ncbi:MAG: FecR domain-containing protein [Labilithrix sp.]|nr:FecR domain-containing protein [Labilithrix sp.]
MKRLAELGAEVSSSLEAARAKSDARSRVRDKLVARQVPRLRAEWRGQDRARQDRRFAVVAGLTLAATMALTAFFAWPRERPEPPRAEQASAPNLSFVVGEGASEERGATGAFIAAPESTETPLTFSDGSTLRLAPAAKLRVAELARDGARVLVESGTVHVSVVHRDDTRWAIEAGPFEVRVTGTQFDVVYDPASTGLVVRMREGSVFVRGCGLLGDEGRRLLAGEQLQVSCKDKAMSLSAADALDPAGAPDPASASEPASASDPAGAPPPAAASPTAGAVATPHEPPAAVPSTTPPAARGPRAVIGLARKGAHSEALMAAEANNFGATCEALDGPELLVLADAARYAGRFDRANEALEVARRRFAGTDAAATASFELGRIAMDVRRELSVAGDHFETYLRERPNGSLAREALGRALEARSRAGDSARAERLAVRYLAAYPDGPHAKLARKLSSRDEDPKP